jgi:hypothetical protein
MLIVTPRGDHEGFTAASAGVCCVLAAPPLLPSGSHAFKIFQQEMTVLLQELKRRGDPDPQDQDIATQLYRVLNVRPGSSSH